MFKYTIAKSYPIPKPPTFYDPSLNGVGIDLGTTRSCTAVNKNNKIDVIAVDNSDRPLPSFIGYEEDVPKCGSIVARRMPNFSQHAVFDVKRIIGKSYESVVIDPFWPFKVIKDGQNVKIQTMDSNKSPILLNPEEISAVLLRHMKKMAEEYKNTVLKEAVLTVPVAFNQNQIDATLEAAALAGWETIHILPEPIAACFTYASENEIPKNSNVLLFDLGGGTLDICIVRIENEELKILKSFGDLYLGGRNFDTLLMNHFNIILRKSHSIDIRERPFRKYKLLLKCQELKHDLEAVNEVLLDVADFDPDSDANIPITRREFKDLSDEILVRLNAKIIEALDNLNLTRHDINYVLQVGGGCRMLMVRELLEKTFPNAQHRSTVDPDWAVAYGAALYCCHLQNQTIEKKMQLENFPAKNSQASQTLLNARKLERLNLNPTKSATVNLRGVYIIPPKIDPYYNKYNKYENIIGIDFGTSTCCAAVYRKTGIETISLENTGKRLLPSYVSYDEKKVKCGQIVVDELRHFSKSTIFDVKQIIGKNFNDIEIDKNWTFNIIHENQKVYIEIDTFNGKKRITPEKVAAELLKQIKQKAEEFQGRRLNRAVVTVPDAFTEKQKNATILASKLAGWDEVVLLPEEIATIFAYFINRPIPNELTILLFDLGYKTLHICVLKMKHDAIKIISNTNDQKLGERNFDVLLFSYFKNLLKTKFDYETKGHKKYILLSECQRIKKYLSRFASCTLDVEDFDPDQDEIISINREDFEKMCKPLLNKIKNNINAALYGSALNATQIDNVLHGGGGSRMPMIRNLLAEVFLTSKHCFEINPDEVVAMGAAYYACNIF